jgi:hypothetical protein
MKSNRVFWFWCFSLTFLLHLTLVLVVPNPQTNIAPDENSYAQIVLALSNPEDYVEYLSQVGGLVVASYPLTLPASFLNQIGINEVISLRIVSSTYSLLSFLLFAFLTLRIAKKYNASLLDGAARERFMVRSLVLLFALLPSHALWNSIGLRESSFQFFAVLSFTIVHVLLNELFTFPHFVLLVTTLTLSLTAAYFSRWQFAFFLSLSIFCFFILHKKFIYFTIGFVVSSSSLLTWISSTYGLKGVWSRVFHNANNLGLNEQTVPRVSSSSIERISIPILDVTKSESTTNTFSYIITNVLNYFWHLFSIIFRPLPYFDTYSPFTWMASIENMIFILLFIFSLAQIIRLRNQPSSNLFEIALFIYLISIVLLMAAYEQNLGTAFRHKSQLLWVMVTILLVSKSKPHSSKITFVR